MHERAGDGVVIALMIVIHPAECGVVAGDDRGDAGIDVDIGPLAQQIEAGGKMRLMRPVGARQAAAQQPFADACHIGVGCEQAGWMVGHVGRSLKGGGPA